jgi:hypothetical protein
LAVGNAHPYTSRLAAYGRIFSSYILVASETVWAAKRGFKAGTATTDNQHQHHNLPTVLAGRGRGTLKPGRHIRYPDETAITNLFVRCWTG